MRRQQFIPLVFLLAALLGCSDDGPTAPPVPGSIGGIVTSTWNDGPVFGAVVVIDGKMFWTGRDGRYLIEDVTPGSYELIASIWDHQVYEVTVSIVAGQLTTHDVVLLYPD
jgi:hypothetical protein